MGAPLLTLVWPVCCGHPVEIEGFVQGGGAAAVQNGGGSSVEPMLRCQRCDRRGYMERWRDAIAMYVYYPRAT